MHALGQVNEPVGKVCHLHFMQRAGIKMNVAECGLIVHPDKGFLAESLDGIVHEVESGATGLLEIMRLYTK